MITYKKTGLGENVYLDGKLVGKIIMTTKGEFTYKPKGSNSCGDYFKTITECEKSLEDE